MLSTVPPFSAHQQLKIKSPYPTQRITTKMTFLDKIMPPFPSPPIIALISILVTTFTLPTAAGS